MHRALCIIAHAAQKSAQRAQPTNPPLLYRDSAGATRVIGSRLTRHERHTIREWAIAQQKPEISLCNIGQLQGSNDKSMVQAQTERA